MTSQSKARDLLITGISTQFPNYSAYASSNDEQNRLSHQSAGCVFDPHCPECIRELWGPLLSPFAYLMKQNAEYFDKIIKRLGRHKSHKSSSPSSKQSSKSLKPPKLEHDDHKFLTTFGTCAFRISKVAWLITWTLSFLLMILSIAILLLKDSQLPPIIVLLRMNQASQWGLKITLQLSFIIITLIGIFKMLASLLGLIATAHRIQYLITGTLVFMSVIILFEIGALLYCAIALSRITLDIILALTNSFQDHYAVANEDQITNAWDRIFQSYQCCGWLINNFSNSHWTPPTANAIPHSCCRPGAAHPACESTFAPSNVNYANQECSTTVRGSVNSSGYVPIAFSTIAFIIIIEIVSVISTFLYVKGLKLAHHRRHKHNKELMKKFRHTFTSYTEKDAPEVNSNSNQKPFPSEQVNDLEPFYNQYATLHPTPPNLDPSLMSITPTVIQVKRPNLYSYFYYE